MQQELARLIQEIDEYEVDKIVEKDRCDFEDQAVLQRLKVPSSEVLLRKLMQGKKEAPIKNQIGAQTKEIEAMSP